MTCSVRALLPVVVLLLGPGVAPRGQSPGEGGPLRFGDPEGLAYDVAMLPGGEYDPAVLTPTEVLGQRHGSRLARHEEVLTFFRLLAESSPRVVLETYAHTYEGRELVRAIVTSPANHERLDALRADHARLATPHDLSAAEGEALVDTLPAIAWMGYSIHGDETSGTDASLAVAYHLGAGLDDDVLAMLDELVVVIDPCLNPDGRARFVAMIEQTMGYTPNTDHVALWGRWPWGRGNHYLFDLNRDWMVGVHPETRGRWAANLDLPPQLFVDAHEMGSLDTYLFYPQAAPHNPHLPARLSHWQAVFGGDQARAFDARGWAYYTREWADAWGPYYSDAWGSLSGAVGILYEQSGTAGASLRKATGRVLTYQESVHHQVVSSLANLSTLRERRREVLGDYLAHKRAALSEGDDRMLVVRPGAHPARERLLLRALLGQGIEVERLDDTATVSGVVHGDGTTRDDLELDAGALVVRARQPRGSMVRSYLSFDVPMDEASLQRERRDLEREGVTNFYDVTAWSLPLLFDLDAMWVDGATLPTSPVNEVPPPPAGLRGVEDGVAPFAWIVDGRSDRSVAFASRALSAGVVVHWAERPFRSAGQAFARGSLVVRRDENGVDTGALLARLAEEVGVEVMVSASGRSPDEGPDLGGGHMQLLTAPRVGLVSNEPFESADVGHLWFLLDHDYDVPVSLLDAAHFGAYDLRRYNVLVLPGSDGAQAFVQAHAGRLAEWVSDGGTLVAEGGAAGALAASEVAPGSVVRRRDALDELDAYALAARRERAARTATVDVEALYAPPGPLDAAATSAPRDGSHDDGETGGGETGSEADGDGGAGATDGDPSDTGDDTDHDAGSVPGAGGDLAEGKPGSGSAGPGRDPDAARQDAWARRFSPAGAILQGVVDTRAWITAGADATLPVWAQGSLALLARSPVTAAVRLAPGSALRLSGLLWPEAAERLADTAWLTVERVGSGQVVLFAGRPAFRGTFPGGARLLANAVVYGPGLGSAQPVGW